MSLLNGLNEGQHQAVVSESKVILCLAGAGTGKTRVLTHRIAYLNEEYRVGTSNMLALTFTRLAGKEMKERIMQLVGEAEGKKLFCNTFHAFCVQVLKEYGHRIDLEPNFMIYDQSDRDSIIKRIIKENYYETSLNRVLNYVPDERPTEEAAVLEELDYRLRQNNAVDFDGLLSKTRELLSIYSDVREHYRNRFKHIFIDEFQDTSEDQLEIIQLIDPDNLFVVGDDFQAIYGWRGARVENILEFPSLYPECEVVKLTRNYRSTKPIIHASNSLIRYNKSQTEKKLETDVEGVELFVQEFSTPKSEALAIIEEVKKLDPDKLSEVAVLARTNRQIDDVANELREHNIPALVLSNRNDPLKDSTVQMVLGYLEQVINPRGSWKLKQLINFPTPRLRPLQLEQIELECIENDLLFYDALKQKQTEIPNLQDFFSKLEKLEREGIYDMDAQTAFRAVVHVLGLISLYEQQGLDNRIQTLAIARDKIGRWVRNQQALGESSSPEAFLRWLVTKDMQDKLMEDIDAVRLMTVHGSKGLEFEQVFIIGMNERIFPSLRGDIEEERRLMYVATTRAKSKLTISRALELPNYRGDFEPGIESRFISELLGVAANDESGSRAKDIATSRVEETAKS